MSIPSINNASSYIHLVLGTALQSAGLTSKTARTNLSGAAQVGPQSDNSQLSPFAQVLNTLQQLQQSDPAKYQQVTQQIGANLQQAAQTAQASGNTTAANQLNQLSTDFNNASKSGQLPSVQDLAQAIGGGHHHHYHRSPVAAASADNDSSGGGSPASTSASASTSTNPLASQILSAFQTSGTQGTQNDSLNPASIILNTLSSAGITTSSG